MLDVLDEASQGQWAPVDHHQHHHPHHQAPVDGGKPCEPGHVRLGPVHRVQTVAAPHQHPINVLYIIKLYVLTAEFQK